MSTKTPDPKLLRAYDRAMLRSAIVSLFWGVIAERKKRPGGYTLQALAQALGANKAEVSRWFNGEPNWTLNTVAGIAHALDLDLDIRAVERSTGAVFTPAGLQTARVTTTVAPIRSQEPTTMSSVNPVSLEFARVPSGSSLVLISASKRAA